MADQLHRPFFQHERLDVYRTALEFVRIANDLMSSLGQRHRQFRDQLIRASMSIPLNIAEGNGKRSEAERRRFFEIARGSAMECASLLDVLGILDPTVTTGMHEGKDILHRIVSMLTRMTERSTGFVREALPEYVVEDEKEVNRERESEDGGEVR
jgi:four helix bundle protein